ncbi:uncharacterized protein LOC143256020 [Tachypleus tridentatus]|uniref:uncharacterized protein LOC143256020 n=1 Tax=Tachypleus tridentatus TaxID=6853 RepID=UPI003FD4A5BC
MNQTRKVKTRVYMITIIYSFCFLAELVSSHITQSLVLLAEAYRTLYCIMSLLVLIISFKTVKIHSMTNTFGWLRVELLGMLINKLFLLASSFVLGIKAFQTMFHSFSLKRGVCHPYVLMIFGIFDFVLNLTSFILIGCRQMSEKRGAWVCLEKMGCNTSCLSNNKLPTSPNSSFSSPNSKSTTFTEEPLLSGESFRKQSRNHQLLDFLCGCCSSLLVVSCSWSVSYFQGTTSAYIDPILATFAVAVFLWTSYSQLRDCGMILLQSAPRQMDPKEVRAQIMQKFPSVLNVHEMHVWQLTSSQTIATVHVILFSSVDYKGVTKGLYNFFFAHGVDYVTMQPEFYTSRHSGFRPTSACILQCANAQVCNMFTCCGQVTQSFTKQMSLVKKNRQVSCLHRCITRIVSGSDIQFPLHNRFNNKPVSVHQSKTSLLYKTSVKAITGKRHPEQELCIKQNINAVQTELHICVTKCNIALKDSINNEASAVNKKRDKASTKLSNLPDTVKEQFDKATSHSCVRQIIRPSQDSLVFTINRNAESKVSSKEKQRVNLESDISSERNKQLNNDCGKHKNRRYNYETDERGEKKPHKKYENFTQSYAGTICASCPEFNSVRLEGSQLVITTHRQLLGYSFINE